MSKYDHKLKNSSKADKAARNQALNVIKELQENDNSEKISSYNTHEEKLVGFAKFLNNEHKTSLRDATPDQAKEYLSDRCEEVQQATVNADKLAIEKMMKGLGTLSEKESLGTNKDFLSEKQTDNSSRSYSKEQIVAICERVNERNALAIRIAHASGMRAHELLTIERKDDRQATERENKPRSEFKFDGRSGSIYTVKGKGGLIREVQLPLDLSDQLEGRRLDTAAFKVDRGINYKDVKYDIGAGNALSKAFNRAAKKVLGRSSGIHGVRHTYAQERMNELMKYCSYDNALETVSQELGHFRKEITLVYLK